MKLEIRGETSRNAESVIVLFFEDSHLMIDATYFENDVPKGRVSCKLTTGEILQFVGGIEAVIFGTQQAATLVASQSDIHVLVKVNEQKSSSGNRVYDLKVEDFKKSKFVQAPIPAARLHSIKCFLHVLLPRIV